MRDSNPRHPPCKDGALPTELIPRMVKGAGLEPAFPVYDPAYYDQQPAQTIHWSLLFILPFDIVGSPGFEPGINLFVAVVTAGLISHIVHEPNLVASAQAHLKHRNCPMRRAFPAPACSFYCNLRAKLHYKRNRRSLRDARTVHCGILHRQFDATCQRHYTQR